MSEGVMVYVFLGIMAICFAAAELWDSWHNLMERMRDS